MPSAIASAVVAKAITAGVIGHGIFASMVLHAVVRVAVSLVGTMILGALSKSLTKKPRLPEQSQFGGGSSGTRTVTFRDPVRARAVIFGQVRTGGSIVFAHTTGTNKFLHLIITLAGHEVNEIGDVLFNDAVVPLDGGGDATGKYAGFASVTKHLGAADQTVDSGLTTAASDKWTSNHRLRGIAYIYVKLTFSADLYPTGIPNISAVVKGREVYDARTSTTAWSANPALCLRDYLTDATYGLGLTAAEIDDTAFNAAANVCDEDVTLTAGGTEDRYQCNGVIDSDRRPRDVIQELLTSMAGIAVFTGGTWVAHAGAYRTPTVTLDEGDLRGPIAVQTRVSRRELFNRVKGLYVSPDNNWQAADFPSVTNATYKTEDNSEEIWKDINLPFTISAATAQRLAKIELERARQQITITLPCKLVAIELRAGDTVKVTNTRFGWTDKVFEVAEWAFALDSAGGAPALGVDLVLRETASAVYDWSSGEETTVDPAPDTDLPDAFTVAAPTSLTLTSGTTELDVRLDGTVFTRLKAAWTAPADEFVVSGGRIEVQAKKSADSDWRPSQFIDGAATAAWILDIQDGVDYDVRVRSVNTLGVRSAFATTTDHTVVGKSAVPANVASLTASQNGDFVTFKWSAISTLDRDGYELRYMAATFAWDDAILISEETKGTLVTNAAIPPGTWVIGIKSIDTSGNYSTAATTTTLAITNTNDVILSRIEHARWAGTLTGFLRHEVSGKLVPDSNSLTTAMTDAQLWDQMVYNPVATATFEGAEYDLGFDSDGIRVFAELEATIGPGESGVADPLFEIDYRDEADSYDGFESWPTAATADFRRLKPLAKITTATGVAALSQFKSTLDVSARTESAEGVTVGTGGTTITFGQQFHTTPNIQVTASGSSALFPVKNSESATAFVVTVYNSGGTDVGGTVDWRAEGG